MAERTRRAGADPDNWFEPPEEPGPERRDGGARTAVAEPTEPLAEDWLSEPAEEVDDPLHRIGALARRPLVAVGALLVVALFVGLAIAGVFGGSNPGTSTTPTTTKSSASTRPTTTAPSSPAAPRVTAPATTLTPGDTGPQVKALQRALTSLGYPVGGIDGVYGKVTADALSRFQAKAGLKPDGVLGPLTLQALQNALAP